MPAAVAAAKSLESCPTLCDPIDGSPLGFPSLGFSRQEQSGLPFPSPVHESEKSKWSHSVVSDSSRPHGLQPTRLLRPWDFPGKSTGVGCHCLLWSECLVASKSDKYGFGFFSIFLQILCINTYIYIYVCKWQPTPVFLPRKSHGQRSLVGYSPWGHKRIRYNVATKQQCLF